MGCKVVFREDADWNHFPYPENFWTSLLLRGCPRVC